MSSTVPGGGSAQPCTTIYRLGQGVIVAIAPAADLRPQLPDRFNAVAYCRAPLLRAFARELAELDDPTEHSPWVNSLRDSVSSMGSLIGHAHWTEEKNYRIELHLLSR